MECCQFDIALLGCDADVYKTFPTYDKLYMTSILKNMQESVAAVIENANGGGDFDVTPYVGTLENGGVGVAPFHDWSDKVSSDTKSELKSIQSDIQSGKIPVKSYLNDLEK